MVQYTKEELTEALRAVTSVIHKCEKAQEKFSEGNSHHTLLVNRLKAMYISKALIEEALAAANVTRYTASAMRVRSVGDSCRAGRCALASIRPS